MGLHLMKVADSPTVLTVGADEIRRLVKTNIAIEQYIGEQTLATVKFYFIDGSTYDMYFYIGLINHHNDLDMLTMDQFYVRVYEAYLAIESGEVSDEFMNKYDICGRFASKEN